MATKQVAITKNESLAPHSPINDQNIFHTEKWQRFSDWLHCICVVNFDLELGEFDFFCKYCKRIVLFSCINLPINMFLFLFLFLHIMLGQAMEVMI